VIYVARNPKDTAVSLYHHAKSKPEFGYTGDFTTFCEIFLAGNCSSIALIVATKVAFKIDVTFIAFK
jgi:hypothetical protein